MAERHNPVKLDVSRVFSRIVGEHGLDEGLLSELAPRAAEALHAVQEKRGKGPLRWMDLPFETEALDSSRELWEKIGGDVEDFVVLGIGGSALGTTCLGGALLSPVHNVLPREARRGRPRLWVLDNIDPDWFASHVGILDPARTVFNVVTKSGTTAETMSQFLFVRKLLEDRLGGKFGERIVCTTDPSEGKLRRIASDEGFATLPVPPEVGGRFSVLSAVGIFPAVAAGMDVEGLLAGARAMDERSRDEDMWRNPALLQAAILHLAARSDINIHVMMPYSERLRDYADWYRQLLAESLGKKLAVDGTVVHAGLTPVRALGVTDQHSQVQLYTEGPFDKLITMIEVEGFDEQVPLPSLYRNVEGVSYLGGQSLAELMAAECLGTQVALEEAGRPFEVIKIERLDARALGELLAWAELTVAFTGELLGVNAFDQPGVEAGKHAAYALMGRRGFEGLKERLQKRAPADAKHVL